MQKGTVIQGTQSRAHTTPHHTKTHIQAGGISAAAAAAVAAASSAAAARSSQSLIKAAFYDMPLLVTSLAAVKDFLVVGDVHHGVSFLRCVYVCARVCISMCVCGCVRECFCMWICVCTCAL
jgi:hypothetical protein